MINIDARKFSIHQFYMARKIGWCVQYNEMHRNPGHHDPENPEYPEEKVQSILNFIRSTGIYQDIDNDPTVAAKIGGRIMSVMITDCGVDN